LKERQKIEYTKELFEIIPKSLRTLLREILTLGFEDEPPYQKIIDKLQKEINKEDLNNK
jgi:hypothetical protein